jgi:hypothetical protein
MHELVGAGLQDRAEDRLEPRQRPLLTNSPITASASIAGLSSR